MTQSLQIIFLAAAAQIAAVSRFSISELWPTGEVSLVEIPVGAEFGKGAGAAKAAGATSAIERKKETIPWNCIVFLVEEKEYNEVVVKKLLE